MKLKGKASEKLSKKDNELKYCYKCQEWKTLSEFSKCRTRLDGLDNRCKSCVSKYQKTPKGKEAQIKAHEKFNLSYPNAVRDWKIAHPERAKMIQRKGQEKFKLANPNYLKDWRDANPDYMNNYMQTPKGKGIKRRSNRKQYAKRKGYDSIELFDNPFQDDIPVVAHHISDAFIVYISENLHINHLHGQNKQLHREELKPFIESIYNFTYIIEEGD